MSKFINHSETNTAFIIGIFLYASLLTWLLFFHQGTGEFDVFQVGASISYAFQTGDIISSASYSPQIQPLLPYLLYYLSKHFVSDAEGVFFVFNLLGSFCFIFFPILLWLLLKDSLKSTFQAKLAVLLFITSPVFIFMAGFGHGFHIAICFSIFSFWIFFKGIESQSLSFKLFAIIIAALIQLLAFLIRFEQILLFWPLIIGLMLFMNKKNIGDWVALGTIFISSVIGLKYGRELLIPELAGVSSSYNNISSAISIIIGYMSLESIISCLPKWLAEIGLPLLFLSAYLFFAQFREKQWLVILGAMMAIMPSFIIYFGNPTPTRHGIISAIGCAIFIARFFTLKQKLLLPIAFLLFIINISLPWSLVLIDGKKFPDRSNVTYNVFQRVERNQKQIQTAEKFFSQLSQKTDKNIVFIGNWIHIAEFISYLVDLPNTIINRYKLSNNYYGFKIQQEQKTYYLIESYTLDDVIAVKNNFNHDTSQLDFISVIPSTFHLNDIEIDIPKELDWWGN